MESTIVFCEFSIYSSESDVRLRLPYLFSKRSTRPAVSTIVIVPVKNGWLVEDIGTLARGYSSPSSHQIVSSVSMVDRVIQDSPDEVSWNTTALYSG